MIKHDKPDEHSREYLLERYTDLIGYTGSFVSIIGGLYLVPLLVLIFYSEDIADAWGFIVTSLLLIVSGGYVSRRYSPDTPTRFTPQESAVIVILVWLIGILGGALPFMFHADLGFAQAVFESTSGWTTTGLTMVDVTEVSRVVLFYRSFIQFLGGLGFMIIALTVLSGSVGVMEAEGHNDRLGIGVKGTARQVLAIYGGYAFFGVALLRLVGMDWFDAVNHAFTALSTGGFSTKPESIAHWDSASVEAVIILLMILGGTNFLTAFTILRGRVRRALRCHELRFAVAVGAIAIITLLLFTTLSHYPTVGQAVRVAVFESVTAISGAGFNIADYPSLPRFAWMVIIILMLMGGVSGSTSGGIKLFRIYILLRSVLWEIKYLLFWPHVVKQPKIVQQSNRSIPVNDHHVRQIAVFISGYVFSLLVGVAVLVHNGHAIGDSLFEFASAIGTVGLSVGITSPEMPVGAMWVMSLAMLLGRLEFYAVVIGIAKLVIDTRDVMAHDDEDDDASEVDDLPPLEPVQEAEPEAATR